MPMITRSGNIVGKHTFEKHHCSREEQRIHYRLANQYHLSYVPRIHDLHVVNVQSGTIVMEKIIGKTLLEWWASQTRTSVRAKRKMFGVLQTIVKYLIQLHKLGILHNDIKGENIMIERKTEHVKIIDFGHSAYIDRTQKNLIQSQAHHDPPEMKKGMGIGGTAIDVFCFTRMLLEELNIGEFTNDAGRTQTWICALFDDQERKNLTNILWAPVRSRSSFNPILHVLDAAERRLGICGNK